jgi:hypothetical protein
VLTAKRSFDVRGISSGSCLEAMPGEVSGRSNLADAAPSAATRASERWRSSRKTVNRTTPIAIARMSDRPVMLTSTTSIGIAP